MDDMAFWCEVCGKSDDAPHTPIDHPWLLKGHRLIPKPKVDEMLAGQIAALRAALEAEIARLREIEVASLQCSGSPKHFGGCGCLCHAALRAALEKKP